MKSIFTSFISFFFFLIASVSQAAVVPAGTLDPSFGPDKNGRVRTTLPGQVLFATDAALQADGKIVVAGGAQAENKDSDFFLARYNSDGTLDRSFGKEGIEIVNMSAHSKIGFSGGNDSIQAITLDKDKIVVLGEAQYQEMGKIYSGLVVARFNSDGTLDRTFMHSREIAFQKRGDTCAGNTVDELRPVGITFLGANLVVAGTIVYSPAMDGSISQSLYFRMYYPGDGAACRRIGFKAINQKSIDQVTSIRVQPDSKILVAGSANDLAIMFRMNDNFSNDATFGAGHPFKQTVNGQDLIVFQSPAGLSLNEIGFTADQKILTAGTLAQNNISSLALHQCNDMNCTNGDITFGNASIVQDSFVKDNQGRILSSDVARTLLPQPNGTILVAGSSDPD